MIDPRGSDRRPPATEMRESTPGRGSSAMALPPQHIDTGLYRLLVESVHDYAIFALDAKGFIVTWNPGAQRFKGYTADEIIGRHFSVFYPAADVASGKPQRELVIAAHDGRVEDEGWRVRKDGTRFWANVVITALRDEAGKLVGFAKVTRDLTERRAAQQRAIEDARRLAEVEASDRAKAEFLRAMSHELRTPLNAIGGYVDLLALGLGGDVTEEQRVYLDRVRQNQQHLLSIINDLLNFSRMRAGRLEYVLEPMPVAAVVESVIPMIGPQSAARRIAIEAQPSDPSVVAVADRGRVEQILINLLSNAIKFSEPGGRVRIEYASEVGRVALRVRDAGIGIPADKLQAIFEPFVQLGRSLTSSHEGTGLGLAISRDLARAMGGELTAESTPGQGATFILRLPAAPSAKER